MKKIKNEHYVPQFYLKKFTKDGNSLFVLDKKEDRIFETNVINIANEKYFYDIDWHAELSSLDKQLIEKELARIDTLFSENIETLLTEVEESKNFSKTDMNTLGNFIVMQWLRTKKFRNKNTKLWEQTLKAELNKELKRQNIKIPDDKYKINISRELQKRLHNFTMFDGVFLFRVLNHIKNHIWYIGINKTEIDLITSDDPVVIKAHSAYDGIASQGIEIALPLSPIYILILCERSYFRKLEELDCRTTYFSRSKVRYYNKMQFDQSYRFVFSPNKNFDI